jgi:Na+/H+-dicarboxylate symporter
MNEARLRTVLMVVAVYHLLLGALMIFAPGAFYDSLGKFPPKNEHYIKDVSTFYIAMGVVVFISVRRRSWRVPVLVFITLEYAIHTLNHLVDVGKAGSDFTGWFDFFALAAATVILAAITTVAWRIRPEPEPEPEKEPAL